MRSTKLPTVVAITGIACLVPAANLFAQSDGGLAQDAPGLESDRAESGSRSDQAPKTSQERASAGTGGPESGQSSGSRSTDAGISSRPGGPDAGRTSGGEEQGGEQSKRFQGMAQVPAGIGERGTGQTQSSLER